jgi:hypothetical protein
MDQADPVIVSRAAAAQLALHTRLAAHHAAEAGAEPAAVEAILAWAILVASGEADDEPAADALPRASEILDEASALPAYRVAADQAEQLLAHFDYEEHFDLADLYGRAVSVIDRAIDGMTPRDSSRSDPEPPAGRLTDRETADLLAALADEHLAHATYSQVLADFGDVFPFSRIADSEARHIGALEGLFHRYGIDLPDNPWPGRATRYESVREACRAAVAAEVENAALYDRLLAGTDRPDLQRVYRRLQEASQQRHLPAFQRCVERGDEPGGGGDGRGRGRGGRHRGRHRGHGG